MSSPEYHRAYYQANREKLDARNRAWVLKHPDKAKASRVLHARRRISEKRALVDALKREPCVDCGRTFPPFCMDWDHLPGHLKCSNISLMVRSNTFKIEDIQVELKKCELVCACCHRIRGYIRRTK